MLSDQTAVISLSWNSVSCSSNQHQSWTVPSSWAVDNLEDGWTSGCIEWGLCVRRGNGEKIILPIERVSSVPDSRCHTTCSLRSVCSELSPRNCNRESCILLRRTRSTRVKRCPRSRQRVQYRQLHMQQRHLQKHNHSHRRWEKSTRRSA